MSKAHETAQKVKTPVPAASETAYANKTAPTPQPPATQNKNK